MQYWQCSFGESLWHKINVLCDISFQAVVFLAYICDNLHYIFVMMQNWQWFLWRIFVTQYQCSLWLTKPKGCVFDIYLWHLTLYPCDNVILAVFLWWNLCDTKLLLFVTYNSKPMCFLVYICDTLHYIFVMMQNWQCFLWRIFVTQYQCSLWLTKPKGCIFGTYLGHECIVSLWQGKITAVLFDTLCYKQFFIIVT